MISLWGAMIVMAGGVAALLIATLVLARRRIAPSAAEADIQVYRDQLHEVERDLSRGAIADEEAGRLRVEIARRLLAADKAVAGNKAANTRTGAILPASVLIVAAALAALLIYARIGAIGYPDMPTAERLAVADARIADRPSQADMVATLPPGPKAEVEQDFLALMAELRAKVDPASSTDPRGLELLARNEAALQNYATAEAAQRRLIAVKSVRADAEDHVILASILIEAANGYVSPEAEDAINRALKLDPGNEQARYYAGLILAQGGRYDRAFVIWRPLVEQGAPDAPWMPVLRDNIQKAASLAGLSYTQPVLPPGLRGPTQDDVAAFRDMPPEERQEAIASMVDGLSARLSEQGGSASEWAQLIRALGVLGRQDEAAGNLAEARQIFAGRDADLAEIESAAKDAGLTP